MFAAWLKTLMLSKIKKEEISQTWENDIFMIYPFQP